MASEGRVGTADRATIGGGPLPRDLVPSAPAPAPAPHRPGWRDGIFFALACAGSVAAAHAAGLPAGTSEPFDLLVRLRAVGAADLIAASLPLVIGVAALSGPALIRARWQLGLAGLGVAWLGLVGLGLVQERWLGQSLDVARAAAGLAVLFALCLLLRLRGPASRPPQRQGEGEGEPAAAPATAGR